MVSVIEESIYIYIKYNIKYVETVWRVYVCRYMCTDCFKWSINNVSDHTAKNKTVMCVIIYMCVCTLVCVSNRSSVEHNRRCAAVR